MEFKPHMNAKIYQDIHILSNNNGKIIIPNNKTKLKGSDKEYVEKELYNLINDLNNKFCGNDYLEKILNETNINMNYVMLEYIKHNSNIKGLLFNYSKYSENQPRVKIGVDYIYTGRIKVTRTCLKNLLFWCYNEYDYYTRYDLINDLIRDYEQGKKIKDWIIDFYILDDIINIDNINTYCSIDRFQTVEISMYLLNNNSISFLENQNIALLLDLCDTCNDKMKKSHERFQRTREWIFNNMDWNDLDRVIMYGSTVLHLYGWVTINDCDLLIVPVDLHYSYDNELQQIISDHLNEKKNKDNINDSDDQIENFLEIKDIGGYNWNHVWSDEHLRLYRKLKVNSFQDLVINPSNYFYFQGIKLRHLDFEIIARFKRYAEHRRATDQADIIMIDTLYPFLTEHIIDRKFIEGIELTYNLIHSKKNIQPKEKKEDTNTVINRKEVYDIINNRYTSYITDEMYKTGRKIMKFLKSFEEY